MGGPRLRDRGPTMNLVSKINIIRWREHSMRSTIVLSVTTALCASPTYLVGQSQTDRAPREIRIPGHAQQPMPAEPSVVTANRAVLSQLPFSDRQDFEDANRGFIATTPNTPDPDP